MKNGLRLRQEKMTPNKETINMKRVQGVLLLITLLVLSGCWDIDEADRMNYVHGVGIDYIDEEIVVYLQIPNMGSLGSPEVTSEVETNVVVVKEEGQNISSIIHHMYQSAQRKLYFGHNTFLVLSEEALRNGLLNQSLDLMNRFPQTRYRINIFATQSNIEELLSVTTLFEDAAVLTRVTDTENTYEISSLVKNIDMRETIIQLTEPGYDAIIPAISLNTETWKSDGETIPTIETVGVALLQPDRYCGFITEHDVLGLRWLQKSVRNGVTVLKDGKPSSEVVLVRPKHDIEVKKKSGEAVFDIHIRSRGMITEVIEPIGEDEIIKKLKKTIEDEIMHTYQASLELESDIFRLSEHLYRYDFSKWKELENDGSIPLNEDSIQISVDIDIIDTSIEKMEPTV